MAEVSDCAVAYPLQSLFATQVTIANVLVLHTVRALDTSFCTRSSTSMQLEVGPDDRPEDPPKIIKCEVLNQYFEDIEPRARAVPEAAPDKKRKKRKGVKAIKNFGLMSFGEQAEDDEVSTDGAAAKLGKIGSVHDAATEKSLMSSVAPEVENRGAELGE